MRATVDHHGVDADFPPIRVIIADGDDNEDVVIKVSDEGGGIPRSNMKKIWSYLFTTADPAIQEGMVSVNPTDDHAIDSPLAGLGYGLPISRSYCQYFGGKLLSSRFSSTICVPLESFSVIVVSAFSNNIDVDVNDN